MYRFGTVKAGFVSFSSFHALVVSGEAELVMYSLRQIELIDNVSHLHVPAFANASGPFTSKRYRDDENAMRRRVSGRSLRYVSPCRYCFSPSISRTEEFCGRWSPSKSMPHLLWDYGTRIDLSSVALQSLLPSSVYRWMDVHAWCQLPTVSPEVLQIQTALFHDVGWCHNHCPAKGIQRSPDRLFNFSVEKETSSRLTSTLGSHLYFDYFVSITTKIEPQVRLFWSQQAIVKCTQFESWMCIDLIDDKTQTNT